MVEKAFANRDVKGVKITLLVLWVVPIWPGRKQKGGRIPLQTMRADIDYAFYEASATR